MRNNSTELAEERISRLKDRSVGIIQAEDQREKRMKKNEQSQRNAEHHSAYQHIDNRNKRTEKSTKKNLTRNNG